MYMSLDHGSVRVEKWRKNSQHPSFSSSLLDEIYRSIDGVEEKSGEFKPRKEKVGKKQSIAGGGGGRVKASSAVEDEEAASLRRACLVEKWMEMKVNEKVSTGRRGQSVLPEFDRRSVLDNDPLFFSSGSSSSESSFGWFSDTEGFGGSAAKPVKPPKPSCFGPFSKPKPVKTSVSHSAVVKKQQNEFYLFDDRQMDDDHQTNKTDHGSLIRSKARALKIYANLKKVKQPISPGGRLTTFLNSLFTNGNGKKPKELCPAGYENRGLERKPKSTHGSTCSSATSFSRSCLSKGSPRSRDKLNNGTPRTVRFYPVSVILDEDSRPCGEKIIHHEQDLGKFRPALPSQRNQNSNFRCSGEKTRNAREFLTRNQLLATNFDNDDFDDDDAASDSSSDLFELDHLAVFKNDQYCEELPVYETTHFDTNRAIASGIVR